VTHGLYLRVREHRPISVKLHPGALGLRWYTLSPKRRRPIGAPASKTDREVTK
jgi:hypothetical protein